VSTLDPSRAPGVAEETAPAVEVPGPRSSRSSRLPEQRPVRARVWSGVVEVAVLGTVFLLYELGRHVVRAREALAFDDAELLLALQKNLLLPREQTVQGWFLDDPALLTAANTYYVGVHFPATIAFLVYLWVRRPAVYTWARTALVSTTMVALLLHVTFPLAPPRMMPGFVDTMAVYGPTAYGEGTESVTNQFAAMPSLHAAWAIVVGMVLFCAVRRPWRWLFLLHPVVTVLVVVVTANHYWLDVAAAGLLVWLAVLAQSAWKPLRSRCAA
jgi:membrane-associated phospholipid phosphatase